MKILDPGGPCNLGETPNPPEWIHPRCARSPGLAMPLPPPAPSPADYNPKQTQRERSSPVQPKIPLRSPCLPRPKLLRSAAGPSQCRRCPSSLSARITSRPHLGTLCAAACRRGAPGQHTGQPGAALVREQSCLSVQCSPLPLAKQ